MNGFLVTYRDSIEERLLDYLDENNELRPEVVKRLRHYASALLEGSITPAAIAEDWADWFDLVGAFVAAYATGGGAAGRPRPPLQRTSTRCAAGRTGQVSPRPMWATAR